MKTTLKRKHREGRLSTRPSHPVNKFPRVEERVPITRAKLGRLLREWSRAARTPCNACDPITQEPFDSECADEYFRIIRHTGQGTSGTKTFVYQYEPDPLFTYMKSVSEAVEPYTRSRLELSELRRLDAMVSTELIRDLGSSTSLHGGCAVEARRRLAERQEEILLLEELATARLVKLQGHIEDLLAGPDCHTLLRRMSTTDSMRIFEDVDTAILVFFHRDPFAARRFLGRKLKEATANLTQPKMSHHARSAMCETLLALLNEACVENVQ